MARRCKAQTKAGKRCKAFAQDDREVCLAHDQERRGSVGFGGPQPGSGRPRNPRAVDRLRERVEADIDKFLQPIIDGLTAQEAKVVGNGPSAYIEFVPDVPTRLKAAAMALDRVYGKPTQAHDIKHTVEEVDVTSFDREVAELVDKLRENAA